MKLFRFTCLAAALLAGTSGYALEITANNELTKVNSGLENRLEATKAALLAAVNDLKDTIDDILARLGVLETDVALIKNNGANNEVQRWNPKLETRLDNIETAVNTSTTKNTKQDNRLTALENMSSSAGTIKFSSCTDHIVGNGGTKSLILCPTGKVMTGLAQQGLATGSKVWKAKMRCCTIQVD